MLDLTRARVPEFADVDVVSVVGEVVSLASASGRAVSDVTVRCVDGVQSLMVKADAAQLRQLVWNLVRNAVQASSAGEEVRVSVKEDPQKGGVLSVEDDGPGIDPAVIPRLFDPFFTTRSHGSGIGLAVVQRIADEHGFEVSVTSRSGQGARFVVMFGRSRHTG
jgi:two-component system sensor histidine kinase HydH